ncbi:hypothetical protein BC477_10140 [Clavibacter michiganensis subsp. michiganensis]|uniref:Uncharacterized protein n=1 Tax=Clavibacter michiganensis subsp. michiganensis TaxID=33013 RepID=A0A251XNQ2_CLAMM|nr:hypothetical protein BC477_10140 [Clavibacter michiganensis subsp. michiganensis]OUE05087.1 hypothetical protein CMMCAS07_09060 [Clavibacter michiganensis subsp. michiganensis]
MRMPSIDAMIIGFRNGCVRIPTTDADPRLEMSRTVSVVGASTSSWSSSTGATSWASPST